MCCRSLCAACTGAWSTILLRARHWYRKGHMPPAFPATVLLAEPDADTRSMYRTAFAQAGWECIEAVDGRDALVCALMHRPSVGVAELRLPLIDGLALCRELRADPQTARLPILIVTSDSTPDRVADALRSGANAVLIKPVPIETIVQTARDMVEGSSPGPASTVMPPTTAVGSAVAVGAQQPGKARAAARRRDAIVRFATTAPIERPPTLTCPECDGALVYQVTHYGGINPTAVERWDEFACESGCGARFEYRFRTRRLRRM